MKKKNNMKFDNFKVLDSLNIFGDFRYIKDLSAVLKSKKNLRVIQCSVKPSDNFELAKVDGGILVQSPDNKLIDEMKVVTESKPSDKEIQDMIFGMKVVKYVKSNAIVVVKDGKTIGIGGGQVNRIWPAEDALKRASEKGDMAGAIMASDAYFPFGDVAAEAAKYGVKAIIQPGGSQNDYMSIDECNKNGVSMAFTGIRHFKH